MRGRYIRFLSGGMPTFRIIATVWRFVQPDGLMETIRRRAEERSADDFFDGGPIRLIQRSEMAAEAKTGGTDMEAVDDPGAGPDVDFAAADGGGERNVAGCSCRHMMRSQDGNAACADIDGARGNRRHIVAQQLHLTAQYCPEFRAVVFAGNIFICFHKVILRGGVTHVKH
jgi:hypothetical protein